MTNKMKKFVSFCAYIRIDRIWKLTFSKEAFVINIVVRLIARDRLENSRNSTE